MLWDKCSTTGLLQLLRLPPHARALSTGAPHIKESIASDIHRTCRCSFACVQLQDGKPLACECQRVGIEAGYGGRQSNGFSSSTQLVPNTRGWCANHPQPTLDMMGTSRERARRSAQRFPNLLTTQRHDASQLPTHANRSHHPLWTAVLQFPTSTPLHVHHPFTQPPDFLQTTRSRRANFLNL